MRYFTYSEQDRDTYPVCILVSQIQADEIRRTYLTPFGLDPDDVILVTLDYNPNKKKTPIKEMRQYIDEQLTQVFNNVEVQYVLCTDADYFKALTGLPKAEAYLGYVVDTDYNVKAQYLPSWKTVFYDPVKVRAKIQQTMEALINHASGLYEDPGISIIHHAEYPTSYEGIKAALGRLLDMNVPLAIDIEAFSLKHYEAGIGTISFSWNKHEGIAFPVDYQPIEGATSAPYGVQVVNEPVRELLRQFFLAYLNRGMYHNISYDVTVLIYQLFMKHICDTEGLLYGMEVMLRNWDCTKLITYLATNSCAGNKLSLKDQSQEFTGNYGMGEDIKDIKNIPMDKLLRYNLTDGLATWYTYEKHWDTLVADDQLDIYVNHFKKYMLDIIQMQLTGMPINMPRTLEVNKQVGDGIEAVLKRIQANPVVQDFKVLMADAWAVKKNATYKKKRVTAADCPLEFNPNSSDQLQGLFFGMLKMPVISLTDSKQPSTDADTIKALINHATDPVVKDLLLAIQEFSLMNKVYTTFLPAMLNAQLGPDGQHYLFGSYNLGGTLSGRLSSSDPNLQNIPVKGDFGKLIKSCFGFLDHVRKIFAGLDFASLEDRISALTTKDPNKLKVYTDGYDGHCLRAYSYFSEQMPDIDPDSVVSINSIEKLYKVLRGESKAPTFALTYQGTWHTLMKNCGFSKEKAQMVESRFKTLYKVSIDWVNNKLNQAALDGYVTGAFGLRVRTPLLKQVIRGNKKTPYEAEAEGRSAGNALGQSWCLLNNRASAEFMEKVRNSEFRLKIRLCAHIHDAQYFLIDDDIETLMFVNEHLVEAVKWQDHPDIWHDEVKLGGELSLFYPDWNHEIGIPNYATEEEIYDRIDRALNPDDYPSPTGGK